MTPEVPRGTHPEGVDWAADLAAREGDAAGDGDYFASLRAARAASMDRRAYAAGFAHIDRLAISGGTVTAGPRGALSEEPRGPSLWQAAGAFALAGLILAVLYGAFVLAWAAE